MMYPFPPHGKTRPVQTPEPARMSLLAVLLPSAVILLVAYRVYGSLLGRLFRLDPAATTPAVTLLSLIHI